MQCTWQSVHLPTSTPRFDRVLMAQSEENLSKKALWADISFAALVPLSQFDSCHALPYWLILRLWIRA